MKLINPEKIRTWVEQVGGIPEASALIIQATGLMPRTAEKLARGTYPSQPTPLVRRALADLTRIPESELFTKTNNDTTDLTTCVNS